MYAQAIINTFRSQGPQYITNIYRWFKSALYDAPCRLWLDIELEKIVIDRNLSQLEDLENEENHSD
jgi:hypothetical protein